MVHRACPQKWTFNPYYIADALTGFRASFSIITLFPAILLGWWLAALILAILLILSDAFDGIAARKWRLEKRFYKMDPGAFDEAADAVLTNTLIGGIAVRIAYAHHRAWSDGILSLWQVLIVVVIALVITLTLIWLTDHMVMPWCKRFEIINGFYFGFLMVLGASVVCSFAFGYDAAALDIWVPVLVVIVLGFCFLKRNRLFDRDESKYKGDKTFTDLLAPWQRT